ncbi:MAG: phosphate ABC transporter substrate-binding protein PstS, partial [Betaproteobacteria bacterium]|nr:phosphate ABC transporter substrate-binding protein PstS [Betaproteobacteria bacterium]
MWRSRIRKYFGSIAVAAGLAVAIPAHAVDITGAGATFPYPIYAKW